VIISAALDAPTLPRLLAARTAATPHAVAFVARAPDGDWRERSWQAFAARVDALARAFVAAGLRPGQRLGILARTSVAWEEVQMAALAAGAVVVGLDPNYADATLNAAAAQARLHTLVTDDAAALARLQPEVRDPLALTLEISADGPRGLDAFLRRHASQPAVLPVASPDDGALVTFSSGTTGAPRAILYTHAQVRLAVRAITAAFPTIGAGTRLLCWLPLANLFQRVLDCCAVATGATSYVVADPRQAMAEAAAVRPQLMIGVPRFFERVHAEIVGRVARGPLPAQWLFARAVAAGAAASVAATPARRLAQRAADRLVLARVRAAFGGEIEFLVSGSAPMPRHLLDWYEAVGLPMYEAYGVSEDIVPIALNRPGARRLGTTGQPLAPNEVKVAGDGEVLVRGPGVFAGYLFAPPDAPTPDAEGWWRTGDLGSLDDDGYLAVAGRKGDAFKTSTGRWIQPTTIEERLARIAYVTHVAAGGLARKAPAVVIDIDPAAAPDPARIAADVRAASIDLAAHARPAVVVIAAAPFSIAGGELTSNLKLRRAAILARHASALDEGYAALERDAAAAPVVVPP
jgi:long-chain acyl-CoA synthetase